MLEVRDKNKNEAFRRRSHSRIYDSIGLFLKVTGNHFNLNLVISSNKARRVDAQIVVEVDNLIVRILDRCDRYEYNFIPIGVGLGLVFLCSNGMVGKPCLALVLAMHDEACYVIVFVAVVYAVVGGVV